jgi:hypothetical protein
MLSTLKWSGAVLALLMLVTYAVPRAIEQLQQSVSFSAGINDDDLPDAEGADTEPEQVIEGVVAATTDFATRNGTVEGRASGVIEIGSDAAEQMIVGFDAIAQDTACLLDVFLEVFLVESTDAELLVLPGTLLDARTFEDGQPLPANAVISDSAPAIAAAAEGTAGWLRWDVSAPYRLAARSANTGAPVVLAISHAEVPPGVALATTLGTTDSEDELDPRLVWSAVGGCEGTGRANPDAPIDPLEGEVAEDEVAEDV